MRETKRNREYRERKAACFAKLTSEQIAELRERYATQRIPDIALAMGKENDEDFILGALVAIDDLPPPPEPPNDKVRGQVIGAGRYCISSLPNIRDGAGRGGQGVRDNCGNISTTSRLAKLYVPVISGLGRENIPVGT